MRDIIRVAVAAAVVLTPSLGLAQDDGWGGFYVAATGGYSLQPGDGGESVRFDTNLDGRFADTVVTTAGANAFSPGFCGGFAAAPVPDGGCGADQEGESFGARLGFDVQAGPVVFGLLAEAATATATDSVTAFSSTPASYTFTRDLGWLAAARARAGVGSRRFLIYVTGGGARARIENRFTTSNRVNRFVPSRSDWAWGIQGGAGIEVRMRQLSVAAEYVRTRLRDDQNDFTVRAQGPAPETNPFILTNAGGTDLRRTGRFEFGAAHLVLSYRF